MGKFFVPSAFEKDTKALKFKTIQGNQLKNAQPTVLGKNAKKNAKKLKKKLENPTESKKSVDTAKVKTGRVEKTKTKKKLKPQAKLTPALAKAAVETINAQSEEKPTAAVSSLQDKLKTELMGGRFRFLNEQLYTMDGTNAFDLFSEDADAFTAYHAGYRHQVAKWPLNPLNNIIKMIKRLPHSLVIGDFGCGEAKLSQSVPNQVFSIDLVSSNPEVISCDMANTPLKPECLDVAVYCLSLMGTNLNEFLLEANRVLHTNGFLYIAEIQSRFDDVRKFVRSVEACGFELIKKDTSVSVFYFFQFKKTRNVGKVALLQPFSLKPCLYRKR